MAVAWALLLAACAAPRVTDLGAAGTPAATPGGTATPGATPTPEPEALCDHDAAAHFPAMWIDGADCSTEPSFQVQQYDENTFILRQSMCTNFEGPFLYLLFGNDRALLEDTGAGNVQVGAKVQEVVNAWLSAHGRASIPLTVVNSHAHGDHVAGNSQLAALPGTTLVGNTVPKIQAFFGIASWPTDTASYDLGGRVVDVVPIPGHEQTHIALYDHATGILFTGDTLYPGRLYVEDFAAWAQSTQRLVDFTEGKDVCWVLGTHVEMTQTPMQDFPYQSTYHPNEHVLQLTRDQLVELNTAVQAMKANPQREPHTDFIISP